MGRPPRVPDPGFALQRFMDQQVGEVHQLAKRAAAIKLLRVVDRGDPSAVIAAIFQPFQRFDDDRGGFVLAQNPYNTAHFTTLFAGPL